MRDSGPETGFAHRVDDHLSLKGPRPTAFYRAIGRQAARARNGVRRLFSAAARQGAGRFASRNKIAAWRRPPLRSGRERCRPGPPAVE